MLKISVVITCYNYEQYIADCIQSCINQTLPPDEIIVVDDKSTDQSVDVIMDFMSRGPVKLIIMPENSGYAAARNEGIRYSKSDVIAELDADDMLTETSIEVRAMEFIEHPSYDLVHGIALRYYGPDDIRGFNQKTYIHAQGRMFRRSVFERFGLYYEGLLAKADKEMAYRLGVHQDSPLPKIIKDKHIDTPVALYRKHPEQMHKLRVANKEYDRKIDGIFNARIKQLRKEGITPSNTVFLKPLCQ